MFSVTRWIAAAGLCGALVFTAVVMARSGSAAPVVIETAATGGELTDEDLPTAVGGLGSGQGGTPSTPGRR